MKTSLAMIALLLTAAPASAQALMLDESYVQADGAILSYPNNKELIDPYFPTKALILASDNGMNVDHLAHGWIDWMLARQNSDGLFSRFCYNKDSAAYNACQPADADDAMMAMWIEMLYRHAKDDMPQAWVESSKKALFQLDALYNPESGVYFISKAMPVGLLMDNIEIYAALKRAGRDAFRIGQRQQSADLYFRAYQLKTGILRTFWKKESQRFIASTQVRKEQSFYPDSLAQIMPSLHGFHDDSLHAPYNAWMQEHRKAWFALIGKEYPWGMVALLASQNNDPETAHCWMREVTPYRAQHAWWDVVDEAAYQAVALKLENATAPSAGCAGAVS